MKNLPVKAIVEVEKGSSKRAVFDEQLAIVKYRELSTAYPFAYGFILNTASDDGDGVDCYILTGQKLDVGTTVDCEPIGLLEQFENEETDYKVICVLGDDNFRIDQIHIQQIKSFILEVFKSYPEIQVRFGEYKDSSFALNYINERTVS